MNLKELIINGWQMLESIPDDPEGTIAMGKMTSMAQCFVKIFPIRASESMLNDGKASVIKGIHQSLANNQALIEVEDGCNSEGSKYLYSIIKTKINPSGVQYFLRAHIETKVQGIVSEVNGFFEENGQTGIRDSVVYELAVKKGIITPGETNQWMKDPYDASITRPYMMNMSESKEFDQFFPEHPLTIARKTINNI